MTRVSIERVRACLARPPAPAPTTDTGVSAAAVAAILRERLGTTEVLLIRRAARERDPWSGHMGLPGGHREAQDASLLDTATRETREEIGLDLSAHARLLGVLPTVAARAHGRRIRMRVTPFVFELGADEPIRAGAEVEEVIWTELEPLARGARDTTFRLVLGDRTEDRPAWNVDGRIVWGLTHQMLVSLFDALASTPPADRRPGG
jgi:8-oxo-dGTP pyrophosphatase MutT (NUDIX family)